MSHLVFQRFSQATDSTCGPTVVRMLLDFYHIHASEETILQATNAKESLEANGTRIDQLAASVKSIAPGYALWYKEDAHINDIQVLIHHHKVPVAVDWQGLFWETLLEEARLSSHLYHGHYSVVTDIDLEKDSITIADPFKDFSAKDRIFPIDWFKSRWWDISDTYGTEIEEDISYYNSRMIFIVVPNNKRFPQSLGMQKVSKDYFAQKIAKARKTLQIHPPFEPGKKKTALIESLSSLNRKILSRMK